MTDTRYQREIEAFRREHEDTYRREDGWLSQVALVWLETGRTELDIGTFSPVQNGVRFVANGGIDVLLAGQPVQDRVLRDDLDDGLDILEHGRRRYQLVRRGGALAVRVRDPDSAARVNFRGLSWFPVDEAWRIVGRLVASPIKREAMRFTSGQEELTDIPGAVVFATRDGEHRLVPYARPNGSFLFVFKDETNTDKTCELCRYFYTPPPDAHGNVVLDFNRAAAPICAYVSFVTCVLPPPENRLPLRVEAGELRYGH